MGTKHSARPQIRMLYVSEAWRCVLGWQGFRIGKEGTKPAPGQGKRFELE